MCPRWVVTGARLLLPTVAAAHLVTYVVVAFLRIGYPFELEALEGGVVDHIARVRRGEPLYVAPSLDFVPYVYTPLYYYVSAAISLLTGHGFLAPRLVSFLSSLACLVMILAMVRRETGRHLPALVAAGLFAATFKIGGAWLDLARVDSLFLLFVIGAWYVARAVPSATGAAIAGLLVSLAFLTKQVALMVALPMAWWFLTRGRRQAAVYLAVCAGGIGLSTLALDYLSGGWFVYYVFAELSTHALLPSVLVSFWTSDLIRPLGIACAVSLTVAWENADGPGRARLRWALLMVASLMATSLAGRLNHGGYDNVLIPAFAGIAVLFGLAFHRLREAVAAKGPSRVEAVLYLACALQFVGLAYNPAARIPRDADLRAGRQLVERLSRLEGDVLIPYHGHLSTLAGKRTFAHQSAIYDVLRGPRDDLRRALLDEIERTLREQRFAAVLVDGEWFPELLARHYGTHEPVFDDPGAFWPVTGARTRPEMLHRPTR